MDRLFDLMWRDAIDTARLLRWIGHVVLRTGAAHCGSCQDNPVRACTRCYEDGMGPR